MNYHNKYAAVFHLKNKRLYNKNNNPIHLAKNYIDSIKEDINDPSDRPIRKSIYIVVFVLCLIIIYPFELIIGNFKKYMTVKYIKRHGIYKYLNKVITDRRM